MLRQQYTQVIPQCQELIPQKVSVLALEPVTDAVGKIIQQQDTADFDLSGYRVSIKKGVAIVDLRIAPNSRRTIHFSFQLRTVYAVWQSPQNLSE